MKWCTVGEEWYCAVWTGVDWSGVVWGWCEGYGTARKSFHTSGCQNSFVSPSATVSDNFSKIIHGSWRCGGVVRRGMVVWYGGIDMMVWWCDGVVLWRFSVILWCGGVE